MLGFLFLYISFCPPQFPPPGDLFPLYLKKKKKVHVCHPDDRGGPAIWLHSWQLESPEAMVKSLSSLNIRATTEIIFSIEEYVFPVPCGELPQSE